MPHLMSTGSHILGNKEAVGEFTPLAANIRSGRRKQLQRAGE
jgi:hypothetical protein